MCVIEITFPVFPSGPKTTNIYKQIVKFLYFNKLRYYIIQEPKVKHFKEKHVSYFQVA